MKSTIALLLACTVIGPTGACSDEEMPTGTDPTNDTPADEEKDGQEEGTSEQSFDCAALLSENDVQEVCGDQTMRMEEPGFIDHEADTSNVPCWRDYSGIGRSSGWSMLGHTSEMAAIDMQKFNLDYAKEQGKPVKMLEGLGPMAYSDSDTEVLQKAYVHFVYKNFNVITRSPIGSDCSLGLARLLHERLNAI